MIYLTNIMESLKISNLIIAIIYTIIILLSGLTAVNEGDGDTLLGTTILSVPVIINWITFYRLTKFKRKKVEEVEYVDVELKK